MSTKNVLFFAMTENARWCRDHRRVCLVLGERHRPAFLETWLAREAQR